MHRSVLCLLFAGIVNSLQANTTQADASDSSWGTCKATFNPFDLNYSHPVHFPYYFVALITIAVVLIFAVCLGTYHKHLKNRSSIHAEISNLHEAPQSRFERTYTQSLISMSTISHMPTPEVSTDAREGEYMTHEEDEDLSCCERIKICSGLEIEAQIRQLRYFLMPFVYSAEQCGWWLLVWIYKDHLRFLLTHLFFLCSHTVIMTYLVYKQSLKGEKVVNALTEFLKVNIFRQTYRTVLKHKGGYTSILKNVIMRWQSFFSIPLLILSYNFGLKELEENTSEWHGIMIVSAIFSVVVIVSTQLDRDRTGFYRPTWYWDLYYMCWRSIELCVRVKLWAFVAATITNYAFCIYMAVQFGLILWMKAGERSLLLLFFYDNRFSLVEKEQKKQQIWATLEDSLFSLFFFDLLAIPRSIRCCLGRNTEEEVIESSPAQSPKSEKSLFSTAPSLQNSEKSVDSSAPDLEISWKSVLINVFKFVEPIIMALIIYIRLNVWTDPVGANPEDIEDPQACALVIQAAVGLGTWLGLFFIIFICGSFQIDLLQKHSNNTLALLDYTHGSVLNILKCLIFQKKCVRMNREENQRWAKLGLTIDTLREERTFTFHELAQLGFDIHEIFALFDKKYDNLPDYQPLVKETAVQLKERANLKFEPNEKPANDLEQLYERIWHMEMPGNYSEEPIYNVKRTQQQIEKFQDACHKSETRLVLWMYKNQRRVDHKDTGNGFSFSAFDLEYSHELFDRDWTSWQDTDEHPLVEQSKEIIHVLMIPPCGKDGVLEFHLLDGITENSNLDVYYEYERNVKFWKSFELKKEESTRDPEECDGFQSPKCYDPESVELTTKQKWYEKIAFSICFSPCIWGGYINTHWICCCRGGTYVTLDYMMNEKDKVRTGDVFLVTTAGSQWLALAQTGHFAHAGLIYKFSMNHLDYLPTKFRKQCEYWLKRGHIWEGSLLVFEMTNHSREWDEHCAGKYPSHWQWDETPIKPEKLAMPKYSKGARLTTLDSYFATRWTDGFYGKHTLIAIRANNATRDRTFWQNFFGYMHATVDLQYAGGFKSIRKTICSVFCPAACRQNKEKLFCSEHVARLQEKVGLIRTNGVPEQVLPSDYGNRKGCNPLQYLCCCFAYVYDARTFRIHDFSEENILNPKDCPLYVLDNASISDYNQQKKLVKESRTSHGTGLKDHYKPEPQNPARILPRCNSNRESITEDFQRIESSRSSTGKNSIGFGGTMVHTSSECITVGSPISFELTHSPV